MVFVTIIVLCLLKDYYKFTDCEKDMISDTETPWNAGFPDLYYEMVHIIKCDRNTFDDIHVVPSQVKSLELLPLSH